MAKDIQDPKDRQDPPEKLKSETDRSNTNDQKLSTRREIEELHQKIVKDPNINGIIADQGLTNRFVCLISDASSIFSQNSR